MYCMFTCTVSFFYGVYSFNIEMAELCFVIYIAYNNLLLYEVEISDKTFALK